MPFPELTPALAAALEKAFGISEPTAIQRAAYGPLAAGERAILRDRTGSGKTLAYLLPLLSRIDRHQANNQLLIIAPTQELSLQITRVLRELDAAAPGLLPDFLPIAGGANLRYQLEGLRAKPPILIGTPGRILELFERRKINGQTIRTVVFDEVDELHRDGGKAIGLVLKRLLRDVQVVAASASPKDDLPALFPFPMTVIQGETTGLNPNIEHLYLPTGSARKFDLLRRLLHAAQGSACLVFLNQPDQLSRFAERLNHHGLRAVALAGDAKKAERAQAMSAFRQGLADVLLTTDVAARGLDLPGLDCVIHLDLPNDPTTYVHRAGRTARGDAEGLSILLLADPERGALRVYGRELGIRFREVHLAEGQLILGPDPKKAPQPPTKKPKHKRPAKGNKAPNRRKKR